MTATEAIQTLIPGRVWLVPSRTKNFPRKVERLEDGALRCSCPARGDCWHKRAIMQLAECETSYDPAPVVTDPGDDDPFACDEPVTVQVPTNPALLPHVPSMAELEDFWLEAA